MSQTETLTVHTVQSQWLSTNTWLETFTVDEPYMRVVGVDSGDQGKGTLWAPEMLTHDAKSGFTEDTAGSVDIAVTPNLRKGVLSFFAAYMTQDQNIAKKGYTCHSLGAWLRDRDLNLGEAEALARGTIYYGRLASSLDLEIGQIGVWGGVNRRSGEIKAKHTGVGTRLSGEDASYVLAITGWLGNLSLMPIDRVHFRYAQQPDRDLQLEARGLYIAGHPA